MTFPEQEKSWPEPVINDRRTEAEKAEEPWGYVVMTDAFMSGWGQAPGTSWYVVPVQDDEEAEVVIENAGHRSEMRNPRLQWSLPDDLQPGDHVSIAARGDVGRWLERDGFAE